MIAQCLQFLPVMRNHLMQHGLLDRVQFIDCPPSGPPHNRSFTCEVRSKLNSHLRASKMCLTFL